MEREISIQIRENQMKEHNVIDEVKETPVIKMEKLLLPKKEITNRKVKGVRI